MRGKGKKDAQEEMKAKSREKEKENGTKLIPCKCSNIYNCMRFELMGIHKRIGQNKSSLSISICYLRKYKPKEKRRKRDRERDKQTSTVLPFIPVNTSPGFTALGATIFYQIN